MKTKPYFLAIFAIFSINFSMAQKASKSDVKKTIKYLKKSTSKVLKLAGKYSENQLSFQPDENTWSVAGNVEHLVKTDNIYRSITSRALETAAEPGTKASLTDEQVVSFVAVRTPTSARVKTAPSLVPKRDFKSYKEAKTALLASRKKIYEYLKTTDDELRGHFAKHPSLGNAALFQWYILAASHTERHYLQMLEVTQHPDFPIN